MDVEGPNDWAYGHNRLIIPGSSRITFKFRAPAELTQQGSGEMLVIGLTYFANEHMPDCEVDCLFNGKCVI